MWALFEDPDIESHEEAEYAINALTGAYPADTIKICAEIFKELEKPYEIIIPNSNTTEPTKERGMSWKVADIEVRRLLNGDRRLNWTVRELAEKVGCSTGTICKCPMWKAYNEKRDKLRKKDRCYKFKTNNAA